MTPMPMRPVPFPSLPGLLAALLLAGCRTGPETGPINLSAPGWTVREGQAAWRPRHGAPEIAGELLLATHADRSTFLQFAKTPIPFVIAQAGDDRWRIEFVPDHKSYSGHGRPPGGIGWLQLARCLAGTPPAPPWRWATRPENRWRLENPRTGESLDGFLAP